MILFVNKETGAIVGTINGRVHNELHLNMWIGDPTKTERIVCNWVPSSFKDKSGTSYSLDEVSKLKGDMGEKRFDAFKRTSRLEVVFEPERDKEVFKELENGNIGHFKYTNGKMVKKSLSEITQHEMNAQARRSQGMRHIKTRTEYDKEIEDLKKQIEDLTKLIPPQRGGDII